MSRTDGCELLDLVWAMEQETQSSGWRRETAGQTQRRHGDDQEQREPVHALLAIASTSSTHMTVDEKTRAETGGAEYWSMV